MTGSVVAGVDIGGTNLRIGLVDRSLAVRGAKVVGSQPILGGDDPTGALLVFLRDYLAETLQPGDELAAVSLGFPSAVDGAHGVVLNTPSMPGVQGVDVPTALAGLGVPVLVDRDTNMLLRNDMRQLRLSDAPGVVFGYYIGTGLGSAFIIEGKVLAGTHGVAGELGHIPFPGVSLVCGCGNTGCAETVASGGALAREMRARHPDVAIDEAFVACADEPFIEQWIEYAAAAAATAVDIFDPMAVVVGGGVVTMRGFPRPRFEAALLRMVRKPLPANDLRVLYSQGGSLGGVVGAAIHAFAEIGLG